MREVPFIREEIEHAAQVLGLPRPKNLGDVPYSFRYRRALPESIRRIQPQGEAWIIRPQGRSKYAFVLVPEFEISPSPIMAETKVPDATPGIVSLYSATDEQALLTKIRYNRLIDIFTGVTCYSLQNHLRTTVPNMGQVETDEIYVGVDRRGAHHVFPVQAKGGSDRLGIVQIEQDFALCAQRFPLLIRRAIAAQFMADDVIALFMFEETENGVALLTEKHYCLMAAGEMDASETASYGDRPLD